MTHTRRELLRMAIVAPLVAGIGATVTTPIPHGYPDWTRQSENSGMLVTSDVALNLVAQTNIGEFFLGNMPYMHVYANSAALMRVQVLWFTDATLSLNIGQDLLVSGAGATMRQVIPVRGPYARFVIDRAAYPGTVTVIVTMIPVPAAFAAGVLGDNLLMSADGVPIGAGASATLNANTTRGGWVHWSAGVRDPTSSLVRLFAVDFGGTQYLLDSAYYPGNSGTGIVFAPALPLRVQVNNFGAASAYSASVTHHPFYP